MVTSVANNVEADKPLNERQAVSLRKVTFLVAALVLAALLPGCSGSSSSPSSAEPAAEGFATGLAKGSLGDVTFADGSIAAPQRWWDQTRAGMGDSALTVQVVNVTADGDNASASLRYHWALAGSTTSWSYQTRLALVRHGDGWAVALKPGAVAPGLTPEERLSLSTEEAKRGDILGAGGVPLVTDRPVVRFGIDKTQVPAGQQAASARSLADLLDIDPPSYVKLVESSGDQAFVEAIVLRTGDVTPAIEQGISRIPGARGIPDQLPLAPTREFARAVLGTVGPVTAEIVAESHGVYRAGDIAGLSGLEQRYDEQLRGTPGTEVQAVSSKGKDRVLFQTLAVAGTDLRTTLDPTMQTSAERALAQTTTASALVAIRPSTGDVLVAANGPASAGYPTATIGQYAPGSTFKVVSSLALLRAGLSPSTVVHCPPTTTVDGKRFKNYSDYPDTELGDITLETAVANSCNTAFIGERNRVTPEALTQAGAALGIGVDHDLGFPAYFGSVPSDADTTTHAADIIGQGHILASPLTMATVAGSVAAGRTVVPHLLDKTRPTASPSVPLTAPEAAQLRG